MREFKFFGEAKVMEANRDAIGSAYGTAVALFELHQQGIDPLFRGAAPADADYLNRVACRLVALHGFNLAMSAFSLTMLGQFDVAPYLFRGVFDAHGLFFGCAVDHGVAKSFLDGEHAAGPARKAAVRFVRDRHGTAAAEMLARQYQRDGDDLNAMSHAGSSHLRRMFNGSTPTLGGHVDAAKARDYWAVLLREEWSMVRLLGLFAGVDDEWRTKCDKLEDELDEYWKAVKAVKK